MKRRDARNWLVPLVRAVCQPESAVAAPAVASDVEADAWLTVELVRRGFDLGLPIDTLHTLGDFGARIPYDRFALLNTTAHALQIGVGIFRREGVPADVTDDALLLFVTLALSIGDERLAERAYQLREHRPSLEAKALDKGVSSLAKKLRGALEDRALKANHPLLGHPFHQILLYNEALLFGRLACRIAQALSEPGGRIDPMDTMRLRSGRIGALLPAISASIALTCADGVVDNDELRLVEALMWAARLEDTQMDALRAEFEAPQTPASLAAEITDPSQRRFVLRLVYLAAHINSHFTDSERAFVEILAAAFGASPEALDRYEVEALSSYEAHTDLLQDLSKSALAKRLRENLSARFERTARLNAGRIWGEIKQTGDLANLLLKASTESLTPDEHRLVRDQLTDICKAVPALALFAVPGGSFLLPLLVKHLPFDILPSAFSDSETLE